MTAKENPQQSLQIHKKMHQQVFSHPDYTVGSGISPNPAMLPSQHKTWKAQLRLAGYTAGRESHPAPKTVSVFL